MKGWDCFELGLEKGFEVDLDLDLMIIQSR